MDTEGKVILSTAPTWCHEDGSKAPWRDHWMQAVYFLDQPVEVEKGEASCDLEVLIGSPSVVTFIETVVINYLISGLIKTRFKSVSRFFLFSPIFSRFFFPFPI